ncbi:methyl-accepting chemotaxis protein [uncultured Idiomarina sp.]|uniref:methyl-accepting chemotaxis protein n=2 Tax=unclassified Idiomarina TaxID=2614829 RepID=UPI000C8DFC1F|nr:chemotaxis protein [Idiomarinaceae bacterium]MEC7642596.1 methyl-accepting chemotaxis protein [Pseudomonadota bacterium]MEC8925200.1 methyl-accepting chemotaxis protein [Pseudomonadota bacterium]
MIRQYSVGVRAAGAFGLIGLLLLALGLFALDRLSSVVEQMDFITDEQVPAIDNVNDLDREFLRVRVHSANVAAYINDEQRKQAYVERLDDANQSLERNLDEYEALLNDAESKKLFKELKANLNEYWQLNDQFMQLVNAKLVEPIASLRESTILPLTNKISTNLDKLLAHEMELINTATDTAGDVSSAAFTGIVVALVVVLVLTVLFAWVLTQSIVKPIQQAVDFSKTIAERDLTHSIEIDGKDEPAQLLKQLRKTQEELRQSIGHIAQSSQQLASTSEELSSVTEDSTRTIQQQTEELEQAATAVNELTTAVENVAQDAQSASEASEAADEQAQFGNDRVAKTVTAIEELSQEIGDSSSNVTELADKVTGITKVLEVIRGIAEQTNLLALNAAIEAARAGESGRGFAVVADEVRSLAHKTQQSTVEIEEMVSAINESSDRSVSTMKQSLERAAKTLDIAREAGTALKQIATAVSEINTHNTSIASASEEQANVARDVDKNLVSIRDLSNSTASGAEQTSASSQELSRLAVELNNLVERFKV